MCLAIPAKVLSLEADDMAVVSVENVRKRISFALLDTVAVGDDVLVHVGYALHLLSEEEAAETLALMAEAGILQEELAEMQGDADALHHGIPRPRVGPQSGKPGRAGSAA